MTIMNDIVALFQNIPRIYGGYYKRSLLPWIGLASILFLPIYCILITVLALLRITLLLLYLPTLLIGSSSGDAYGFEYPIMGFVALPILLAYYVFYVASFVPFLLIGALCDLIAEIISRGNHQVYYRTVWSSVFSAPHKEAYSFSSTY
jgi:hypothetical protein